jgi:protein MPE1
MSHVYYKFKSQKDPSRVVFDGPGISVFDLKREIILLNKLGSGTDFDLAIYDESTNEGMYAGSNSYTKEKEYTDDNAIIPRATSIIVRRLPPSKPGKGNGAKYVSGAITSSGRNRTEFGKKTNEVTAKSTTPAQPSVVRNGIPGLANAKAAPGDENAAIQMMMSAQRDNWDSTQQAMAMANPVYNKPRKPLQPVPDKPPPQGYVCHRCNEKGHWIQECPTNLDPNFENRPRIKRTTGIPKTFLKRADKPLFDDEGEGKSNGVMVDADGEYVVFEPDSKSWATYQAKANASEGDVYSQPLSTEHKDWECQICGKLAKDATRTPCCKKLFCDECIQSSLLESDFVCPGCGANEILLDDLVVDGEVRSRIAEYVGKWEDEKKKTSINVCSAKTCKTHSQEALSPTPNAVKRERSSTPTEDGPSKKVKTVDTESSTSRSPNLAKSPPAGPAVPVGAQQFDPFSPQFAGMPPFMPGMPLGMPGMFPPDPFMMAAMGFPPMPGMMPMPPMGPAMGPGMGPGMYPQQQQGYNQQVGNHMYGRENSAYMRPPVNDRGYKRNPRGGGSGRNQADYREVI